MQRVSGLGGGEETSVKATELIEKLSRLILDHGDLEIYLEDWSEEYSKPAKATSVEHAMRGDTEIIVIDA